MRKKASNIVKFLKTFDPLYFFIGSISVLVLEKILLYLLHTLQVY